MWRFTEHEHDTIPADVAAALDQSLGESNDAAAPLYDVRRLAVFAFDAAGALAGGAIGRTWGDNAELVQLWVNPALRKQGLGAELVRRFEARAAARGCRQAYLETFSFQAPKLYASLGYVTMWRRGGFAAGIDKHVMQHVFAPTAGRARAAPAGVTLRQVPPNEPGAALALARLLEDGVASGASVGFLWPMAEGEAQRWADGIVAGIGPGLLLWFAERDGEVIGTVQLVPVLKANGRHRAEVSKLLVHRSARGAGVATGLLQTLEAQARALGITLLALDTEAGSAADTLYERDGWRRMGEMPGHSVSPNGVFHDTAYFFKVLG